MNTFNKIVFTFCLVCYCFVGQGQNLIPNGDFEFGPGRSSNGWTDGFDNDCNLVGVVLGPDYWVIDENTPDRLIEGDIPCNWDDDIAQSGKAYVIFGYAEAGRATLLSPLQKDSLYNLKYCISLETLRGLFIDSFHVEFILNGGDTISSVYASNPPQWLCYETVFIASETSTEIKIRGIDFVNNGVKIDNISLTKVQINSLAINKQKQDLLVFPNPVTDYFQINQIHTEPYDLIIYNALGQKLFEERNIMVDNKTINTRQFTRGLLLITIKSNNQLINYKLLKQ